MSQEQEVTFRNCVFRYKCPESWDGLDMTGDPEVRHCRQCDRTVHYCATEDELVAAIKANQCVAIPTELAFEELDADERLHLVGNMQINYDYGKE